MVDPVLSEVLHSCIFRGQEPFPAMRQDVVQGHELGFDPKRRAATAVTVIGLTEERVERLRAQVIDVRVTQEHVAGRMIAMKQLLNKIARSSATGLAKERIELPAKKIAAMERCELEELRFAFGVAKFLKCGAHGITLT